jgi:hypothetical protein
MARIDWRPATLITQRSEVQILPPLPGRFDHLSTKCQQRTSRRARDGATFAGTGRLESAGPSGPPNRCRSPLGDSVGALSDPCSSIRPAPLNRTAASSSWHCMVPKPGGADDWLATPEIVAATFARADHVLKLGYLENG